MPFLFLLIAALLLVTGVRNSYPALFTALKQDLPGFGKWAAALVGVGALGWVPGLREPSRWLMGLVILVLILKNYQQLFSAFQNLGSTSAQPAAATVTPAAAYVQSADTGAKPPAADTSASAGVQTVQVNAHQGGAPSLANYAGFDPSTYLTAFQAGMGFGGVV